MNLIVCFKDCKYQKDGFCDLHDMQISLYNSKSDCCYYTQNDNENLDIAHHTSNNDA